MTGHPQVRHPAALITRPAGRLAAVNDRLLAWLAGHVLASRAMFNAALFAPLAVLPMSTAAKVTLGVISGSWIQWWALPALQRSQVRADELRQAKADADHQALTHIAVQVDAIAAAITGALSAGPGGRHAAPPGPGGP